MKPRGGIVAKQFGEPVVEVEIIGEGIDAWEIRKVEGLVEVEGDVVIMNVGFHLFEEKT